MSLSRVLGVMRKELAMGPRSPVFLYAIVVPVLYTVLIQVVFGSLLDPAPRLGLVDEGQSQITEAARAVQDGTRRHERRRPRRRQITEVGRALEGVDVRFVDSSDELKELVERNDLDGGLVLQPGFDDAVKDRQNPLLQIYVGGESLASNRLILGMSVIDLVRSIAGATYPLEVEVATVGAGETAPLTERLLPFMVVLAVLVAGTFVTSASLVEEKERGTLNAVLVTPTQVSDVMLGKGGIGFVLATFTGLVTLALNNAFGAQPLALVAVMMLAAMMTVEFGLMLGAWAKDETILFSMMKGGSIVLWAPVIFYIWPDLPEWIARLFPSYYFLSPIYDIAIKGASLGDVAVELAIGAVICVALVPLVILSGRYMENRLAAQT